MYATFLFRIAHYEREHFHNSSDTEKLPYLHSRSLKISEIKL